MWGRQKKTLERKEQIYHLLACLEEKRRDSGSQMQAGVDSGQLCATAVLVGSLHSRNMHTSASLLCALALSKE